MENIYLNNPEDDFFDGPSDDDLKRIEKEIKKYLD
tara:strand:+ start:31 stop:135 length:105 start_codon:yes stop_codon:yes gene_type:complete